MSTRFDFAMSRKAAEKEYGLESGGYFKPKEGANKFRVISAPLIQVGVFKGKKNPKYVCWVFDYADQKVKLYFMPPTVYKMIEGLQESEEYRFDELPMPYDLTLNAKSAGTIEVNYQLTPARANSDMPVECMAQLVSKEPIEEVVKKLNEKNGAGEAEPEYEADEDVNPLDESGETKQARERAEIAQHANKEPLSNPAKNIGAA